MKIFNFFQWTVMSESGYLKVFLERKISLIHGLSAKRHIATSL